METKSPNDSLVVMNELVLPNDTNLLNNLMGGRLMHWMDICAATSAQKHARAVGVTAAVNNVSFNHPIPLGNLVTLQARVIRAFNTSMEVHIMVWTENLIKNERILCNEAFFTFVALNQDKKPIPIPHIQPTTEEERQLYDDALLRRQLKLLTSGKITIDKAPELRQQLGNWMANDKTTLIQG